MDNKSTSLDKLPVPQSRSGQFLDNKSKEQKMLCQKCTQKVMQFMTLKQVKF